jgi:hypothetical protein
MPNDSFRPKADVAAAIQKAKGDVESAIEQTHRIYGVRLLLLGLLWLVIYAVAHALLMRPMQAPLRVTVALMPLPFFIWYLWTWMKGAAAMDELERRIELEALGFAFPATLVWLMKIGLMKLAFPLEAEAFSWQYAWLMMPMLYYIGLWRAKRRYA